MMDKNGPSQVLKDPRFKVIVRKKWRLSFALATSMTLIYVAFVLTIIFKPEWLRPTVSSGNPFNIGLLLTLIMILFIMGCMIGYVFFKRKDSHADIHQLIAEHEGRE